MDGDGGSGPDMRDSRAVLYGTSEALDSPYWRRSSFAASSTRCVVRVLTVSRKVVSVERACRGC